MKTSIKYFFSLVALAFLLTSCGNQEEQAAQDTDEDTAVPMEVSPEVIFENDYARVVKVTLEPGASLAAHEGEQRVIYSLSDYSIDWVEQGKDEGTKSWKTGDVHFHQAGQHSAKNNGNATAEWLAFVKKDAELPDCSENTEEQDVNSVAPDGVAKLSFDNEVFRITEVTLPPGASIPMHSGVNRVVYSLSDYQTLYEAGDEGKEEKSFKKGDVHWHDACLHALENIGETEAKYLVVSYKD
jgi:quercetin dioxygenase-like cupin family protein